MTQTDHVERGARVRFPPPLVFLGGILLGVACNSIVAPAPVPTRRAISAIGGLVLIIAGVGFLAWSRGYFTRTGQSPIPWKPSPSLILQGPYRYTRNPMYVGMTLCQLGIGLAANNLWISLFAGPALAIVHFIAVRPEERYLADKFGEDYKRYLTQVRRYL